MTPVCAISFALAIAGCEKAPKKEKVIDIKAPGVSIEVEKDANSADVKVETDQDRRR